jgi:hypothetical protein
MEALPFRLIGYVAGRVVMEPRISATPGPVAEKPCCGAVRFLSFTKSVAAEDSPQRAHFFDGRLQSLWFSIGLRPVSADLTSSR